MWVEAEMEGTGGAQRDWSLHFSTSGPIWSTRGTQATRELANDHREGWFS
jgi:hypothetical protein